MVGRSRILCSPHMIRCTHLKTLCPGGRTSRAPIPLMTLQMATQSTSQEIFKVNESEREGTRFALEASLTVARAPRDGGAHELASWAFSLRLDWFRSVIAPGWIEIEVPVAILGIRFEL